MGSATTQALAASTQALAAVTASVDIDTARELFAAVRAIDSSRQLAAVLADPAVEASAKSKLAGAAFGTSVGATTLGLLTTVVGQRWSSPNDLLGAIEELGLRAASIASLRSGADVESELFQFARVVTANPELELTLGARIGDNTAKAALVETLLAGRASVETTLIVSSLVQQPRGRRVHQLLADASRIVADQRGQIVATVTTAAPMSDAQRERLVALLSARYGRPTSVSTVIDPAVVGGLRVQIGDDVIDASIASRLNDLRLRLAG